MAVDGRQILKTDRLDRQLIHSLVVDGRAPFRRLADVLGTSEQTVARRYRRLREARALRVIARPNPRRFDQHWIVRVRVRPSAAVAFAEAVAQRADVSWVGLTAGGTEVTFTSRTRTLRQRDTPLLERLPRSTQVLDVSAACVLHIFAVDPETEWRGLADALEPAQVAALAAHRRRGGDGPDPRPDDAPLLAALARDGRAGYAALAAEIGETEARVARRVEPCSAAGRSSSTSSLPTNCSGIARVPGCG